MQASYPEIAVTTRVTLGRISPKSSYFYIIDKVLKFLLAAGGLSILRPAMPLPHVWVKCSQRWETIYAKLRQAALSQFTVSGGSSHPFKKRELEVCWKERGWEGCAGRRVPLSVIITQSLSLQIPNYSCIYYKITLRLYTSQCLVLFCAKGKARG